MEKKKLIVYWIATALLSVGMLGSGIGQLIRTKEMVDILSHLGYPVYLMTILGIWKILGVIVILMPGFKLVKEWAYAGFFFTMTGALISHLIMGDTGKAVAGPLMQTIFVILSWYFRPVNRKIDTPNK
ncbi:DoxX family protein [Mucilaginibacter mali]|uniref:DoxX family protein n=1 Tax=Mucilaginibacter mali TaxID=2740462 RepID=A0A7D4UDF6_9SPHI|nr:DoxX family protein [Mucilaginibacter mali]QKJ30499.1 DoxX family protein [Mucilaginibacter mali]